MTSVDTTFRASEREGDPVAKLLASARAGDVSQWDLEFAAMLGEPRARELLPHVELLELQAHPTHRGRYALVAMRDPKDQVAFALAVARHRLADRDLKQLGLADVWASALALCEAVVREGATQAHTDAAEAKHNELEEPIEGISTYPDGVWHIPSHMAETGSVLEMLGNLVGLVYIRKADDYLLGTFFREETKHLLAGYVLGGR